MKQSNERSTVFNDAATAKVPSGEAAPVTPVSEAHAQALLDQLSQPRLVAQPTPMGSITRDVNAENDNRILAEVADMRRRLEELRNKARDDFNMAHDGPGGASLRPRMRM